MFAIAGASPGAQTAKCMVVKNVGSIPELVSMYGTVGGTGLAPYITLKITRGAATSPTGGSCSTFTPDAGAGATVFNARLNTFPTSSATALQEPGPWAVNESHAYKFDLTVDTDPNGQGKSATASFTWEGRSS
jgi:hypothetical protein